MLPLYLFGPFTLLKVILFAYLKLYFFQTGRMRVIIKIKNMLYLCSSTHTFLDVFRACDFDEQSLLCELFLHNTICEHVSIKMVVTIFSYMGDLQL